MNYDPYDRSDSNSLKRPKTKQSEYYRPDLNQTFMPYYENKNDEKPISKNFSKGRLSHGGIPAKPKTVQEWRRRHYKSTNKVISFH